MSDHLRSAVPTVRQKSRRLHEEQPSSRAVRPDDDAQVKMAICILVIAAVLYVVSAAA